MEIIITLLAAAILFGCISGLQSLRRDAQRAFAEPRSLARPPFEARHEDEPAPPLDRA